MDADVPGALRVLEGYINGTIHSSPLCISEVQETLRRLLPTFRSPKVIFRKSATGGIGVYACEPIKGGEYVLVDHPELSVLDVESAQGKYAGFDGCDSISLVLKSVSSYSSSIDSCLRSLYPIRDSASKISGGFEIPEEVSEQLRECLPPDIQSESAVLAIQLNSLGYYTFPELCSHSNHLRFLTGTGIYPSASKFNHSCEPNVSHFSIGDVSIFCASKDVNEGEELFISYIGNQLLVESKSIRDEFLDGRDFKCRCTKCSRSTNEADPWLEELDLRTRATLNVLKSSEKRVQYIRNVLQSKKLITRDRLELQFMLCRELGSRGQAEWDELLDKMRGISDLSTVVVYMHYMVYFDRDEGLMREALEISRVSLGERFGLSESIRYLLSFTEFSGPSSLRESFEKLWIA